MKAFLLEQIEMSRIAKGDTMSDKGTSEQIWINGYETGYTSALNLTLTAIKNYLQPEVLSVVNEKTEVQQ